MQQVYSNSIQLIVGCPYFMRTNQHPVQCVFHAAECSEGYQRHPCLPLCLCPAKTSHRHLHLSQLSEVMTRQFLWVDALGLVLVSVLVWVLQVEALVLVLVSVLVWVLRVVLVSVAGLMMH